MNKGKTWIFKKFVYSSFEKKTILSLQSIHYVNQNFPIFGYFFPPLHELIKFFETNLTGILSKTTTANIQSIFSDQTMMVTANTAVFLTKQYNKLNTVRINGQKQNSILLSITYQCLDPGPYFRG